MKCLVCCMHINPTWNFHSKYLYQCNYSRSLKHTFRILILFRTSDFLCDTDTIHHHIHTHFHSKHNLTISAIYILSAYTVQTFQSGIWKQYHATLCIWAISHVKRHSGAGPRYGSKRPYTTHKNSCRWASRECSSLTVGPLDDMCCFTKNNR